DLSAIPARDRARLLAYVAQRPTLSAAFTVRETVALGRFASAGGTALRAVMDEQNATVTDPVSRALSLLDLADRSDDLFHTLSVGQQQRAALARALCQLEDGSHNATQALIVDEPTAALDPRH